MTVVRALAQLLLHSLGPCIREASSQEHVYVVIFTFFQGGIVRVVA